MFSDIGFFYSVCDMLSTSPTPYTPTCCRNMLWTLPTTLYLTFRQDLLWTSPNTQYPTVVRLGNFSQVNNLVLASGPFGTIEPA